MKKIITALFFLTAIIIISCQQKHNRNYDVRIDFRFGNKFVSLKLNPNGSAYALKGHCSSYTEAFKVSDSVKSEPFKIDSAGKFYSVIHEIEAEPALHPSGITDCPRTEIYYKGKKIYDVYFGDKRYWFLFAPIMGSIPKDYSPFQQKDNVLNSY